LKPAAKIKNAREMKTCLRLMILVPQNVFCYHPFMQSFDTDTDDAQASPRRAQSLVVGELDDLRPGACVRFELPDGDELAVFNVGGEFYAIDNSCPHKGAPLSEGTVCGHVVECGLHGWQFNVRTGECLTVRDRLRSYPVRVEDGRVVIDVSHR
jgi:nitrite reductase (NADH) small subunit